jgi:hypothetical protein
MYETAAALGLLCNHCDVPGPRKSGMASSGSIKAFRNHAASQTILSRQTTTHECFHGAGLKASGRQPWRIEET